MLSKKDVEHLIISAKEWVYRHEDSRFDVIVRDRVTRRTMKLRVKARSCSEAVELVLGTNEMRDDILDIRPVV